MSDRQIHSSEERRQINRTVTKPAISRRWPAFLLSVILLFGIFSINRSATLAADFDDDGWMSFEDVKASSYCVLDGSTGQVIFEKNAEARRSNASTTKILTALTLVDDAQYNPSRMLKVSERAITLSDPNSARIKGLKAGDEISTLECLAALLIASANDIARVIAENYGGAYGAIDPAKKNDPVASEKLFVEKMNRRAKEIGLENTHFTNPAGFDEADKSHYTTARDLAYIALGAMKNPQIAHIVGIQRYRLSPTGDHRDAFWAPMSNSNGLVVYGADLLDSKYFRRYTGVKTGTTPQAGKCLVGSGETYDGKMIICVALNLTLPAGHANNAWLARALPVRALMEEGAKRLGCPAVDRGVNLLAPHASTLPTEPREDRPASAGAQEPAHSEDQPPGTSAQQGNVPAKTGTPGTGVVAAVRALPIVLQIFLAVGILAVIYLAIRLIAFMRRWERPRPKSPSAYGSGNMNRGRNADSDRRRSAENRHRAPETSSARELYGRSEAPYRRPSRPPGRLLPPERPRDSNDLRRR